MNRDADLLITCAMLLWLLPLVWAFMSALRSESNISLIHWFELQMLNFKEPRKVKALRQIDERRKQDDRLKNQVFGLRAQLHAEIEKEGILENRIKEVKKMLRAEKRRIERRSTDEVKLELKMVCDDLKVQQNRITLLRRQLWEKEEHYRDFHLQSQVYIAVIQSQQASNAAKRMLDSTNFKFPKDGLLKIAEGEIARREASETAQLEKFVKLFADFEIEFLDENELVLLSNYVDDSISDLRKIAVEARCFETELTARILNERKQYETWIERSKMAESQEKLDLVRQALERARQCEDSVKIFEAQVKEQHELSKVLAKLCSDLEGISTKIMSQLKEKNETTDLTEKSE